MVWAGPGAGGVAAGPGVCRRIGEGGRAIESADLGGRLPPILTQVAGMAQTDGSLVDAGSLSQYGPTRGFRHHAAPQQVRIAHSRPSLGR
jgi:hypothetical protein